MKERRTEGKKKGRRERSNPAEYCEMVESGRQFKVPRAAGGPAPSEILKQV